MEKAKPKYDGLFDKYGLVYRETNLAIQKQVDAFNELKATGLNNDVQASMDYIKKCWEGGDPDMLDMIADYRQYVDDNYDKRVRKAVFDKNYVKDFNTEYKKIEREQRKKEREKREKEKNNLG